MVDGIAVYAKLVLVKTRQHELRELLPVPEPLRLHGLELALEGVLWVGGGRGEGRGGGSGKRDVGKGVSE